MTMPIEKVTSRGMTNRYIFLPN
uniref:Uncharacterized protein n=1 Tax=Rhizophora mucronata TaxID=61149 RepID=A0A2P2N0X2_RHIMU